MKKKWLKIIYVFLFIGLFIASCENIQDLLDVKEENNQIEDQVVEEENNQIEDQVVEENKEIVEKPVFTPISGEYYKTLKVTINCPTPNAEIYYTLDGTTPTKSSLKYATEIQIAETTTIKTIAIKEGMLDSSIVIADYLIRTWRYQASTISETLLSVYFIDKEKGWAVGNSGTIISTTDGGDSWISNTSPVSEPITNVFFISSTSGYITSGGKIYFTTDNCQTWSEIYNSSKIIKNIIFIDSETGYFVGYKKYNSGSNYYISSGIYSIKNNSVTSLYYSSRKYLYDISVPDKGNIFVVGNNFYNNFATYKYNTGTTEYLLKSIDLGQEWTLLNNVNLYDLESYNKLQFLNKNTGYMLGKGKNGNLVWFMGTHWTDGVRNILIKTTDGGGSWTKISLDIVPRNLFFIDEITGWVIGKKDSSETLYFTMDAGENWITQISDITSSLKKLHFIDKSVGYAVGENGIVLKYN